jgi:hypothetical protein
MIGLANPKMIKIALVVGMIAAVAFFSYRAGRDHVLAQQAELLKEKDRRIAQLQTELETDQDKIKVVYRDKIRTIRTAADTSGCADTRAPDDILRQFER